MWATLPCSRGFPSLVKCQRIEYCISATSSSKFKNDWSYTYIILHTFVTWCLTMCQKIYVNMDTIYHVWNSLIFRPRVSLLFLVEFIPSSEESRQGNEWQHRYKQRLFPYYSVTGNFLASKFIAGFKCVALTHNPISFLSHPTTQLLSDCLHVCKSAS